MLHACLETSGAELIGSDLPIEPMHAALMAQRSALDARTGGRIITRNNIYVRLAFKRACISCVILRNARTRCSLSCFPSAKFLR